MALGGVLIGSVLGVLGGAAALVLGWGWLAAFGVYTLVSFVTACLVIALGAWTQARRVQPGVASHALPRRG